MGRDSTARVVDSTGARPPPARRDRWRWTHLYLGLAGLLGGVLVLVLTVWAYYDEGPMAGETVFGATVVVGGVLFLALLWGCLLLMRGTATARRLPLLAFHAALGCISPLAYTVIISAELPSVGNQPPDQTDVLLAFASALLIGVQMTSGLVLSRRGRRVGRGGPAPSP